jgi:hypothetical protein
MGMKSNGNNFGEFVDYLPTLWQEWGVFYLPNQYCVSVYSVAIVY